MSIWRLIVESNTFNFAILLIIFAVLAEKLHISDAIEKMKQEIVTTIENAKQERENAKSELLSAEKSIENIEDEIKSRLQDASKRAEDISSKIMANTEEQIRSIENNIQKAIETEEKTISADAINQTLQKSVQLAEKHIKKQLKENPELHNKFIEESIGAL